MLAQKSSFSFTLFNAKRRNILPLA